MQEAPPPVTQEEDLLRLALWAAARAGDANPKLVQHVSGTREQLTTLTGSIVHSQDPCYLIAISGSFAGRPRFPRGPERDHLREEAEHWTVQVLVVEIDSGRIVDSGGGDDWPDLASLGPVVTDSRRSP